MVYDDGGRAEMVGEGRAVKQNSSLSVTKMVERARFEGKQ
jgi:hypothetical protein